jgi:hypothetical protein
VVRVDHQVIAIITTAIAILVCAGLVWSLFLLELSAFCTRDFRFPCHGRRGYLVLVLVLSFFFFLSVVVVGIIALISRKIIRSDGKKCYTSVCCLPSLRTHCSAILIED